MRTNIVIDDKLMRDTLRTMTAILTRSRNTSACA